MDTCRLGAVQVTWHRVSTPGSLIKKAADNVSLCWGGVCGEKILAGSCSGSLETKAPGKQEQTALTIVHSHRTQWTGNISAT